MFPTQSLVRSNVPEKAGSAMWSNETQMSIISIPNLSCNVDLPNLDLWNVSQTGFGKIDIVFSTIDCWNFNFYQVWNRFIWGCYKGLWKLQLVDITFYHFYLEYVHFIELLIAFLLYWLFVEYSFHFNKLLFIFIWHWVHC